MKIPAQYNIKMQYFGLGLKEELYLAKDFGSKNDKFG